MPHGSYFHFINSSKNVNSGFTNVPGRVLGSAAAGLGKRAQNLSEDLIVPPSRVVARTE